MDDTRQNYVSDDNGAALVKFVKDYDLRPLDSEPYDQRTLKATDRLEEYVVSFYGPENPVQIIHHFVDGDMSESGRKMNKAVYVRTLSASKAQRVLIPTLRNELLKRFNKRVLKNSGQEALALAS